MVGEHGWCIAPYKLDSIETNKKKLCPMYNNRKINA